MSNTIAMTRYASGLKNTLNLKPEDVCAWDWAWALQHQGRFSGSTPVMWSVLSHTGLVYTLGMLDTGGKLNPIDRLSLLLHDASEAYMVDMPRPIKTTPEWAFFREVEDRITSAIFTRFGLSPSMVDKDLIKRYDNQALYVEYAKFFPDVLEDRHHAPPCVYPMGQLPQLIVAKPKDYIDILRDLTINLRETVEIKDFDGLFKMPPYLAPYVDEPEAPPLLDANERATVERASILDRGID